MTAYKLNASPLVANLPGCLSYGGKVQFVVRAVRGNITGDARDVDTALAYYEREKGFSRAGEILEELGLQRRMQSVNQAFAAKFCARDDGMKRILKLPGGPVRDILSLEAVGYFEDAGRCARDVGHIDLAGMYHALEMVLIGRAPIEALRAYKKIKPISVPYCSRVKDPVTS